MSDGDPRLDLCAGTYRAQQVSGTVLVFADGFHPTSGYQAFLFQEAPDSAPPRFSLWHVRAAGFPLQVITPFSACTSFQTTGRVQAVTVRDAVGVHVVSVAGASPTCEAAARTGSNADGSQRKGD